MGIDVYLRPAKCEICGHQEQGFSSSYTYNVSTMWFSIYPQDKQMVQIDGMSGYEAYKKLFHAYHYMKKNEEELKNLNPPNGWGSYDGFLNFISELTQESLKNPQLIWEVCR